ncbi:SKP1-like protein 11 [Gastrolobium bilobum]|uniref:SKP1-like protein 11 n=1 Tax=Gastrolobium bilobum TaxID=150636 RepID=UPI002AB2D136|nr:SKP1-like protein 11 [Gastrolobium bilobum]
MSTKMLKLRSSEKDMFEVEEAVIVQSVTIKNLIDDECGGGVIPLENVNSLALAKVLEYCNKHHAEESHDDNNIEALKKWDDEFVKVDQHTLFLVMMAANYLKIKSLLELTCQIVANLIKDKSPEEIRQYFNIKNDFSPEEEEEAIRNENRWAFE